MLDLLFLLCGLLIGITLRAFSAGREVESWLSRVASRRRQALLICAVAAMLPRLALLPWLPPPIPKMHDEFSYILGAQTLAPGRVTNPTPAFWQHFESYHINMTPTYQSMYPPAPSLFYALGIVAGGDPWWGVWLSTGLMCASICWALQSIIGPRYALLAGIFCALKYGVFTYNSDSFIGGSVAALGGALTLGASVRLISGGQLRHVFWLVFGAGLLANSRPFEGILFAIPILSAILVWILRHRRWRVLALATLLCAILSAAMGYYNWRGTGYAWKMPYLVNFAQYHFISPFLGMALLPHPQYHHPQMAAFYEQWEGIPGYLSQSAAGILQLSWGKLKSYDIEHFAPLLLLALFGIVVAFRSARRRILAITFLLVSCGLFSVVWRPLNPYPAPLLVSYFGLAMLGIRSMGSISVRGFRLGPYAIRGLALALLLFGAGRMCINSAKGVKAASADPSPWYVQRAHMIQDLTVRGGDHLVLVKYAPGHDGHHEWVYNTPQIDKQKVIFARSMGDADDCSLIRHYAGRQIWILDPDAGDSTGVLRLMRDSPLGPTCK